MNHIIWRRSQKLSNDGELVDVVLAREEWFAVQHLCKDTACTPDINLNVILLPCEHNLRSSVVSCGHISGHLGVLNTCETEIADLEIAVLVDEDVAGLQIAMDDACRMDILETTLKSISYV